MACHTGSTDYPPLIKSPLDPLEYRAIKLDNGLKALLISTIYGRDPPEPGRKDQCVRVQVDTFNATHLGIGEIADPAPPKNLLRPLRRRPVSRNLIEGGQYHVFFTIGSGMMSDSYPGMAHFTEHLIFFGSQKYPEHEGFTKFLKRCEGDSNATTSLEFTCFEFTVNSDGIEEALDRFNDLVMNPLWNVADVGKERNALTSEFWNLWMLDKFRYQGVLNHLANPDHPMSKLGLGHGGFLNIDPAVLAKHALDWKRHYYVSNNISIVMISPASLDTMRDQVVKHFSRLTPSSPGRDSPRIELRDTYANVEPMDKKGWNRSYFLRPSQHNNCIFLSWLLPPGFGQNFKTKPLNILSFIMMNRCEGGLDDFLRKKGWLLYMCTHCHSVDHTVLNTIFMVTLFLTKDGINHAEDIVREVFLYFQRLQASSTKELHRMFDELRLSQADSFHYRSDQHIASSHFLEELDPASIGDSDKSVHLYKMFTKFLLVQDECNIPNLLLDIFVSHKWDEKLLRETMMKLLDPTIANVLVARKDLKLPEPNDTIPWNGIWYFPTPTNFLTDYNIYGGWAVWKSLWGKRAHTWGSSGSRKYSLPPENRFTRSSQCFPISKSKSPAQFELKGCNDLYLIQGFPEFCRRGYLSTSVYSFQVKSDIGLRSMAKGTYPQMALLGKCWDHILLEKLAEAVDTVITVNVDGVCDKLRAIVRGPAATLPRIFKDVVESFEMLEKKIDYIMFTSVIEEILSNMDDNKSSSEYLLERMFHYLLDKHVCSKRNFEEVYQDLTYEAFLRFIKKFKAEMKITIELAGCVKKEDAKSVEATIQNKLSKYAPRNAYTKPSGKNSRFPLPESGKEWRFVKPAFNPLEASHWVKNYYQIGDNYADEYTLLCIIDHLSEEVYHQLRGVKHLGYVADAEVRETHSVVSLEIRVNALAYRFNSDWLEKEIDTFLTNYYHKYIGNKKYFSENVVKKDNVSWEKVKRCFQLYLLPSGKAYKKLSIHIVGSVDAVPCSLRYNEPHVRKNGSKTPINILNPIQFKNELTNPYPNTARDDDNSEPEDSG